VKKMSLISHWKPVPFYIKICMHKLVNIELVENVGLILFMFIN